MYSLIVPELRASQISLTGLKSQCWQATFLLEAFGDNLSRAFSSFWKLPSFLAPGPPSIFKASGIHGILPSLSLVQTLLPPSFLWDLLRFHEANLSNPGWPPHLKIINLVTLATSPVPCQVTDSQIPEISIWTF